MTAWSRAPAKCVSPHQTLEELGCVQSRVLPLILQTTWTRSILPPRSLHLFHSPNDLRLQSREPSWRLWWFYNGYSTTLHAIRLHAPSSWFTIGVRLSCASLVRVNLPRNERTVVFVLGIHRLSICPVFRPPLLS